MHREQFIRTIATGSISMAIPFLSHAQSDDPLPLTLVKDFVIAGHGNFDKTKQMVAETPALIYAAYDWKNGDFETALEGAGHVGNKDIANYLIEKGARANLFVLTMLGKTTIVKPFLEAFPQYLTARGPHGLTLLHHAQKGGEEARELAEYLSSRGLKETKANL
jgi:hypothetical protein